MLTAEHLKFAAEGEGPIPSGTQTQAQAENLWVYSFMAACAWDIPPVPDEADVWGFLAEQGWLSEARPIPGR